MRNRMNHEAPLSMIASRRESDIKTAEQRLLLLKAQEGELTGELLLMKQVDAYTQVIRIVCMKRVRVAKAYRGCPGAGSWDAFCKKACHKDRKAVEEEIANLDALGEDLLQACMRLRLKKPYITRLREAVRRKEIVIDQRLRQVKIGTVMISTGLEYVDALDDSVRAWLKSNTV